MKNLKSEKNSSEFIDYLNEYQTSGKEVTFETIGNKTYWITKIQGAGNIQEYYWENNENALVPKYIFEYGGMDWDKPLEYTFISIENNDTITGHKTEAQIAKNKIDFIKRN